MKYGDEFVKNILDSSASGRAVERTLGVPRKTVYRWRKRVNQGFPARFKRSAKRVWNKAKRKLLKRLKRLLKQTQSSILAWVELGKLCLRTVQRYKRLWFPPQPRPKRKIKRYERRKVFSLMHTDWGVKRIKKGVRCCFSFYEDDASRKLFALRAYNRATLENTLDNLKQAKRETGGFKAVLTDCGGVYRKNFDAQMNGIKHIRTRPHNPKCNGKAENIVKKAKRFLSHYTVRNIAHANALLSRFQREYNNTPHSSLKYRTPNQVYRYKRKNGVISAVT